MKTNEEYLEEAKTKIMSEYDYLANADELNRAAEDRLYVLERYNLRNREICRAALETMRLDFERKAWECSVEIDEISSQKQLDKMVENVKPTVVNGTSEYALGWRNCFDWVKSKLETTEKFKEK